MAVWRLKGGSLAQLKENSRLTWQQQNIGKRHLSQNYLRLLSKHTEPTLLFQGPFRSLAIQRPIFYPTPQPLTTTHMKLLG